MRTPSRFMPLSPPNKLGILGWTMLMPLIVGAVWYFLTNPIIASAIIGLISAASYVTSYYERRRISAIIQARSSDSICSFARSFDTRLIDTRIIRATYEEIGAYLVSREKSFPLRSTDSFWHDLRLYDDWEDIAQDIAYRTGRSLDNTEQNPYFDKIDTVADLVNFFMAQPEIRQTPAR